MADLRIYPKVPKAAEVTDPGLHEGLRRLEQIEAYCSQQNHQWERDIVAMVQRGHWAAPKND